MGVNRRVWIEYDTRMEVELSAKAQRVIEERVAVGDFASAAQAIEEAVRLLDEQHAAYTTYLR